MKKTNKTKERRRKMDVTSIWGAGFLFLFIMLMITFWTE